MQVFLCAQRTKQWPNFLPPVVLKCITHKTFLFLTLAKMTQDYAQFCHHGKNGSIVIGKK
jgi:hypothetical protein